MEGDLVENACFDVYCTGNVDCGSVESSLNLRSLKRDSEFKGA